MTTERMLLRTLEPQLSELVDAIKRLMPAGYVVTLVLRHPQLQAKGNDVDVVFGDDCPAEAAVVLARAVARKVNS